MKYKNPALTVDIIIEKNGKVVQSKIVDDNQDLIIISKSGMLIRTPVKDISIIGRVTQGVRMMRLDEQDTIMNFAIVPKEEQEENKI